MIERKLRLAPGVTDVWSRFMLARLAWILLMTVLVTASAGVFLLTQKPMYKSQATVAVYPASGASSAVQPFVMGTEKGVVASGAVLSLASQSLLIPVSKLQKGMSISIPVDSDLLVVAYTDPDPQVAQSVAETIAQAYVAYRTSPLAATNPKGASTTASLQAAVVTDATLPASPDGPSPLLTLGIALLVGLALGIGLALLRDWLDDSLRGADDLRAQTYAPVLAQIPPDSTSAGSAYRDLRTRVLQTAMLRQAKTLLVTSSSRGQKSEVASNLAASIALSGRRVVLVCADLAAGNAHAPFGVHGSIGLTTVVGGEAALADALVTTKVHGLEVLASGPPAHDPSGVLQSHAFQVVLTMLRTGADFVIIDAPPVLAGADAAALAESADMVLLVADARTSTRAEVRDATHELVHVRDRLIGCVLDRAGRAPRLGTPVQHMQQPYVAINGNGNGHGIKPVDVHEAAVVVAAVTVDASLATTQAKNGAPHGAAVKTKRRRHQTGRNEL